MEFQTTRKLRDHDTWGEVRRAWEAGETGASLARRYDVGLDNLWRRRATEGWVRRKGPDPKPEPIEGWDRYARAKMEAFELKRDETRQLSAAQIAAITTLTRDGVRVLSNVATGRSPWHGWEGATAARTPESQEAYEARARAITECRARGVLTPENLLTDMGRRLLSEWEGRRG